MRQSEALSTEVVFSLEDGQSFVGISKRLSITCGLNGWLVGIHFSSLRWGFGPPSRLPKGIYDVLSYGITVLTHYLRKHFLPARVLLPFQNYSSLPVGEAERYVYIG